MTTENETSHQWRRGGLLIRRLICGPIRTCVYLIQLARDASKAVVVDAAPGSFSAIRTLQSQEGFKISAILITHGHWDHMADAALFQQEGVPVWGSADDLDLIARPDISHSYAARRVQVLSCYPDFLLHDGMTADFLAMEWRIFQVMGHTPGGLIYFLPAVGVGFTGDSIFQGTIGRSDFPYGDGERLVADLRRTVLTWPDSVLLFPGHGDSTTVGHERAQNPFLQS